LIIFFNLLNTHARREKQSQAAQAALVHRNSRPGGSRLFFRFLLTFSLFLLLAKHTSRRRQLRGRAATGNCPAREGGTAWSVRCRFFSFFRGLHGSCASQREGYAVRKLSCEGGWCYAQWESVTREWVLAWWGKESSREKEKRRPRN
jgi:hypothetical protein